MKNKPVSIARLHEILRYDAESGHLYWRATVKHPHNKRMGMVAGYRGSRGYIRVRIDGQLYWAHRLIWLYVHGQWPKGEIDHINGHPEDNRLNNLRVAQGPSQQQQNQGLSIRNKSGYIGVCWDKNRHRWRADIQHQGRTYALGRFDDLQTAHKAYCKAKRELHTFNPVPRYYLPGSGRIA